MTKRVLILLMVGVNLFLLAGLFLSAYTPPQAMAQLVSRSGEYILISAEADVNNDVIYLVDVGRGQLHAFFSDLPFRADKPITVQWVHSRDLLRDFR